MLDFQKRLGLPMFGLNEFSWEQERFSAYIAALNWPQSIDQVGGWNYELQGDPRVSAVREFAGVTDERYSEMIDEASARMVDVSHYEIIESVISEFGPLSSVQLLAQLELLPGGGWGWFDGGHMNFFIERDALERRDFSCVFAHGVGH